MEEGTNEVGKIGRGGEEVAEGNVADLAWEKPLTRKVQVPRLLDG